MIELSPIPAPRLPAFENVGFVRIKDTATIRRSAALWEGGCGQKPTHCPAGHLEAASNLSASENACWWSVRTATSRAERLARLICEGVSSGDEAAESEETARGRGDMLRKDLGAFSVESAGEGEPSESPAHAISRDTALAHVLCMAIDDAEPADWEMASALLDLPVPESHRAVPERDALIAHAASGLDAALDVALALAIARGERALTTDSFRWRREMVSAHARLIRTSGIHQRSAIEEEVITERGLSRLR